MKYLKSLIALEIFPEHVFNFVWEACIGRDFKVIKGMYKDVAIAKFLHCLYIIDIDKRQSGIKGIGAQCKGNTFWVALTH